MSPALYPSSSKDTAWAKAPPSRTIAAWNCGVNIFAVRLLSQRIIVDPAGPKARRILTLYSMHYDAFAVTVIVKPWATPAPTVSALGAL